MPSNKDSLFNKVASNANQDLKSIKPLFQNQNLMITTYKDQLIKTSDSTRKEQIDNYLQAYDGVSEQMQKVVKLIEDIKENPELSEEVKKQLLKPANTIMENCLHHVGNLNEIGQKDQLSRAIQESVKIMGSFKKLETLSKDYSKTQATLLLDDVTTLLNMVADKTFDTEDKTPGTLIKSSTIDNLTAIQSKIESSIEKNETSELHSVEKDFFTLSANLLKTQRIGLHYQTEPKQRFQEPEKIESQATNNISEAVKQEASKIVGGRGRSDAITNKPEEAPKEEKSSGRAPIKKTEASRNLGKWTADKKDPEQKPQEGRDRSPSR